MRVHRHAAKKRNSHGAERRADESAAQERCAHCFGP
jgi:hypothetical protein